MKGVRVMQISDSLFAAGRERMAVNLANLLEKKGFLSYLCTTRADGPLESQVGANVKRLRLARKHRFDIGAVRRLVAFIREHQIDVLHAHGPSLFIARVAALFPPNPAVIWHDNDGNHGQTERPRWLYGLGVAGVNGVISATKALAEWSRTRLHVPEERIWYLPNFVQAVDRVEQPPDLPGDKNARIVCVAGLRRQKDHITLIQAIALVIQKVPHAHLLIVGGAKDEGYLAQIHSEIGKHGLEKHISLLGERQDIQAILQASRIGVLSSASEAFPLALLEYGAAGLPAVVTRVGQCAEVLDEGRVGMLVEPGAADELADAIIVLIQSPELCASFSKGLKRRVQEVFGPNRIAEQVCQVYAAVCGSPSTVRSKKHPDVR